MSTSSVAAGIVATLEVDPILSNLVRTFEYHGGAYDEKELKRYGHHSPALLLTWMGTGETSEFPAEVVVNGRWSLFIVTRKQDRHISAQDIHDRLMQLLRSKDPFGLYKRPTHISSMNAYSTKFDAMGIELISIGWQQEYRLDDLLDVSALPLFNELDTCYWPDGTMPDVPDAIGADGCLSEDLLELEQD